jgi:hypothetical protein
VISRSIIKKTFSENKALHSANAQEDERFERNASVVQKGIRSVICVPLTIGGHTRGVLYLSRGSGGGAFDQLDLELISACAIQLGLTQHMVEQRRRHRTSMWQLMVAMVRSLEAREGCLGTGERCARSCMALGEAAHLNAASRARLGQAGLLHHYERLCGGDAATRAQALAQLEGVEELEAVLPLVRLAQERLDGGRAHKAAEEELEVEASILSVAAAFEARTFADTGADPTVIIDELMKDPGLDSAITHLLHGCHLDGSLYANREVAP